MTNNRITEQFSSLLPELRNAGNCRIPYHTSGSGHSPLRTCSRHYSGHGRNVSRL